MVVRHLEDLGSDKYPASAPMPARSISNPETFTCETTAPYTAPELRPKSSPHKQADLKVHPHRPDQYACGALAHLVLSAGAVLPLRPKGWGHYPLQGGWEEAAAAADAADAEAAGLECALARDLVRRLVACGPDEYR